MNVLAGLVLDRSGWIIVGFAVLTALLAFSASRVDTNDTIEALYPDDSEVQALAEELEATFGLDDRLLVTVEGDVYTPEALTALRDLTRALEALDETTRVTSVATAQRIERGMALPVVDDLLPAEGPLRPEHVSAARDTLTTSPLYRNVTLVTPEGDHASLVVEMADGVDAAALAGTVDTVVSRHWDGPQAMAGQAFTSRELQAIIARDLPLLGGLALTLILLMLWLNFRTLHGTLLPLLQIAVGVVWALGAFQWLGFELMALTVIGPIAVMAVGSSFALHLLGRFAFERAQGATQRDAIRRMLGETGLGVLVSGLAIAAAMGTFLLSDLAMVRGLGLLASLGVLATLAASLLLLPALLNVLPAPRRMADPERPGAIGGLLAGLARFVVRRPRSIVVTAALLVAVGGWGVTRIVPDTSILAFFPADGPTRTSVDTVERVMGGSGTLTAAVQGDFTDPATLASLAEFQRRAQALDAMGPGRSIVDVLRTVHPAVTGEPGLPSEAATLARELQLLRTPGGPGEATRFLTDDGGEAIVTFATRSMSTSRAGALQQELQVLADDVFGASATARFTGQPLLEREIEQAMRHDFLVSLTLAIALVIAIDSLVRSFRAAAVTILALLATVVLQYGLLGWLGLSLDLATMLMGALAIGVGDYAIHLTVRYMEERRHGHAPEQAVERTLLTSGRQILFTALTLGAGFAALLFADFVPVATLGGLMVLTVALVGLATLTLLPAVTLIAFRHPHPARATPAPTP